MPKSQLFTAAQLKALVIYLAAAFAVILVIGAALPAGQARALFVVGWMLLFPFGAWKVLRSSRE